MLSACVTLAAKTLKLYVLRPPESASASAAVRNLDLQSPREKNRQTDVRRSHEARKDSTPPTYSTPCILQNWKIRYIKYHNSQVECTSIIQHQDSLWRPELTYSSASSKQQLVHAWTIYSLLIRCFGDYFSTNWIYLDTINSKHGFVPWLSWVAPI
jgi:hypothetical protein